MLTVPFVATFFQSCVSSVPLSKSSQSAKAFPAHPVCPLAAVPALPVPAIVADAPAIAGAFAPALEVTARSPAAFAMLPAPPGAESVRATLPALDGAPDRPAESLPAAVPERPPGSASAVEPALRGELGGAHPSSPNIRRVHNWNRRSDGRGDGIHGQWRSEDKTWSPET